MNTELLNIDCMEYMKGLEDNAFDLAIVDPPYLDAHLNTPDGHMRGNDIKGRLGMKDWADAPKADYFKELARVSREQIIFGGNYFTEHLASNNNWFLWYKNNDGTHLSMAEMAWVSIRKNVKVFELRPMGLKADFHPTSKPIKLYGYLLRTYAKEGDRILDTHLGSGSSAIAAHYGGFDFVGCELDEDYYKAACARFDVETAQIALL